ncbi:MAG: acetate kinase [Bacteroidales bacterium]|jgi:acetate kinase|nr:acetate kinase [Bacteroidales bacterium]
MKILVLNCGSSSIKYQLIEMEEGGSVTASDVLDDRLIAKGIVERIGLDRADLTQHADGKEKVTVSKQVANHQEGVQWVLEYLMHPTHGVIKDVSEISAAGHRVAHGGETFKKSTLITPKVMEELRKTVSLAPLHNPANIKGIESISAVLPSIPQVAVFDTSFHQSMPDYAYMYAIPYRYYEEHKIRRYGFHGTSHKFVVEKAAEFYGLDYGSAKIISCHLGNGASIAAVVGGRSVDTSMGYTPVEGLVMGTRAGDIDAGVVFDIMRNEGLTADEASDVFNRQSGLQGISGLSSDMRDLNAAASAGNDRARLALDMFAYRVKKYIGAYAAAMGGVDVILFTGGIGENDFVIRARICKGLEFMGAVLDVRRNDGLRGVDTDLTADGSRVKICLMTTNEELVIARETETIVNCQLSIVN